MEEELKRLENQYRNLTGQLLNLQKRNWDEFKKSWNKRQQIRARMFQIKRNLLKGGEKQMDEDQKARLAELREKEDLTGQESQELDELLQLEREQTQSATAGKQSANPAANEAVNAGEEKAGEETPASGSEEESNQP